MYKIVVASGDRFECSKLFRAVLHSCYICLPEALNLKFVMINSASLKSLWHWSQTNLYKQVSGILTLQIAIPLYVKPKHDLHVVGNLFRTRSWSQKYIWGTSIVVWTMNGSIVDPPFCDPGVNATIRSKKRRFECLHNFLQNSAFQHPLAE